MKNKKESLSSMPRGVEGYLGCMLAHHYDNIYSFCHEERD